MTAEEPGDTKQTHVLGPRETREKTFDVVIYEYERHTMTCLARIRMGHRGGSSTR